jgi:hypothetical protein
LVIGVSLLAFDENMRIIHLERRNDMGQWAFFSSFFGMTYFSFVFYPERHDWVAAMLSKSPQNAGMHWLFHTY